MRTVKRKQLWLTVYPVLAICLKKKKKPKKKKKQVVLQPVLWMRKLRLREQKTLTKVTQSGTGRVRLNVGLPQKGKEVGDELRECH